MAKRNLVILLHGVGSNGANLVPVGNLWKETLPDTDFVSPDGPFPFGRGPGRQWFSIDGVTEANRADRVAAARPEFDRVVGGIIEAHDTNHVALVGFSQGSIMALDVLASGRLPVAAIVAFSGRLASPEPIHPAKDIKLCLIHGDADPIMPFAESERAAARLTQDCVDSTLHILPGLGHSISQDGARIAGDFLAKAFAI